MNSYCSSDSLIKDVSALKMKQPEKENNGLKYSVWLGMGPDIDFNIFDYQKDF